MVGVGFFSRGGTVSYGVILTVYMVIRRLVQNICTRTLQPSLRSEKRGAIACTVAEPARAPAPDPL